MDDLFPDPNTDVAADYYYDPSIDLLNDPLLNSADGTAMNDLPLPADVNLDLLTSSPEVTMDDNMQYPASIDPSLAKVLEHTDHVLRDTQAYLDHRNQQHDASTHFSGNMDSLHMPSVSSDTKSTMDMLNRTMQQAQGVADGKYSMEEMKEMNARGAQMIGFLGGLNAAESISNSVSQSHHDLLDRNYSHHLQQMANESESSGNSHLHDARAQASQGESAKRALDAAERDFANATHYREQAKEYNPNK